MVVANLAQAVVDIAEAIELIVLHVLLQTMVVVIVVEIALHVLHLAPMVAINLGVTENLTTEAHVHRAVVATVGKVQVVVPDTKKNTKISIELFSFYTFPIVTGDLYKSPVYI
jgi:hypothetical protein